jgi:hypothetical protein
MIEERTTLCVFGATGFTGKRVAYEVAKQITLLHKASPSAFRWSIAGRRTEALETLLAEIRDLVGASAKDDKNNVAKGLLPDIVKADVNDVNSLGEMARSTRLVLNCVGPYHQYGENVVLSVIEASEAYAKQDLPPTHYIDLSGEPNFIERMVLAYRGRAKAAKSIILPAAAYDSVPAEFGTIFALSCLGKGVTPASVEMIAGFHAERGIAGHFATYACVVNGISPTGRSLLSSVRKQLYSRLPKAVPRVASMGLSAGIPKRPKKFSALTYDNEHDVFLIPHMAADPAVVRLGQSLTMEEDKSFEPAKFVGWFAIPSLSIALMMAFYFSLASFLVRFDFGRSLLLKYPKFFTGGVFSHEGPTNEQIQSTSFVSTFTARGYSHSSISEKTSRTPDVKVIVRVRGPEPGYSATPILFVTLARAILAEEDKIERGVSVPGAAMRKTTLIKMLNDDGRIKFERVQ